MLPMKVSRLTPLRRRSRGNGDPAAAASQPQSVADYSPRRCFNLLPDDHCVPLSTVNRALVESLLNRQNVTIHAIEADLICSCPSLVVHEMSTWWITFSPSNVYVPAYADIVWCSLTRSGSVGGTPCGLMRLSAARIAYIRPSGRVAEVSIRMFTERIKPLTCGQFEDERFQFPCAQKRGLTCKHQTSPG